jgi:alpha amylase catalytic region
MKKKWWHDKVAYQIYPKSFLDTNGDGIGDLRGIISKLDYLKDLGVDIIWLSPIFASPFADQGYDISDYYNIDPRFGTMEDMDELIKKAKERGMYILMDLVVNHCSDEHEWFKKACEDPNGKYGKYFYIEDVKDGKVPTNWRSYFGGSVWDKLPGHEDKYYMHVFHKKQPDLNWENEEVREEIYKMVNWWMDKGLGGFRIDAIINIKKALPLTSYEPDRDDGMCSTHVMLKHASGVGEFLTELRDRCFKPYDAFTVGEVFDAKEEELLDFISENGYFSSMFDFSTELLGQSPDGWYKYRQPSAKEYINAIFNSQKRVKDIALLSNIIENHDEPRGVSHYIPKDEINDKSKKLLALINIMVKGIPFIYQGQEIGMENTVFNSIDDVDDISTLDQYSIALQAGLSKEEALNAVAKHSRDNARTPMPWNSTDNAGFTTGNPWLKVNPSYKEINVEDNLKDEKSIFNFYKELIHLRKSDKYKDSLSYGSFNRVDVNDKYFMAFTRVGEVSKVLVLANFQNKEAVVDIDLDVKKILINNYDSFEVKDRTFSLKPYQAIVVEV